MTHADTTYRTKKDRKAQFGEREWRVLVAQKGKQFRIIVTAPGINISVSDVPGPIGKADMLATDLISAVEDYK